MIDKDLDNIYLKGSIINNKIVYGVVRYGNVKLEVSLRMDCLIKVVNIIVMM